MAEDYEGLYGRALRALTGVRDWYSEQTDPNRPRKRGAVDVNLPVAPPVEKPWYEKITSPLELAEQIGRKSVEPVKAQVKSAGGKLAGALGATSESSGRAFGAALDVFDPRNTGSEKKPVSDIAWEGLKGVRSGYEAGLGATSASQEFTKRASEETLRGANPVQRGMLGLGLDVVTDPTNLVPEKYLATGAGALLGAGDIAQTAWLTPSLWKKARGVEGFSHNLNYASDAEKILQTGFGVHSGEDVLERMGHAGYYTPAQAKTARASGQAPKGLSNQSYSYDPQLPIDFPETTKVLDVRMAPVPREDIDVILSRLDPVQDKNYIESIEKAWEAQRPYAEAVPHADVRSGKIKPEVLAKHYKTLNADPVARKAIEDLNSLLTYPSHSDVGGYVGQVHGIGGVPGKTGTSALNHPSMPMEYGAIHYSDYVAGHGYDKQGSIAFDPRQTLVAPPGTTLDPKKTPWQPMGLAPAGTPKGDYGSSYFKGVIPSDAPGGVSAPLPGQAPSAPVVQPPTPSPAIEAQQWVEQNVEPPKNYPPGGPAFMGKPISVYEQGTLKELEAAGRPLDALQTEKLKAVKLYESGQAPDSSIILDAADLTRPATMEQHWNDVQSTFEEAPGFDAEGFTNWNKGNPDLTPAQLHANAIDELEQAGFTEAANDLKQLWDTKVKSESPYTPSTHPALADFIDDVEPVVEKVDVFDPGSGKSFGTFDSQAQADAFINSHPQRQFLDSAPHDPLYMAGETEFPSTVQYENLDVAGENFDALMKGATRQPAPGPKLIKKPELPPALPEGFGGFDDIPEPAALSPMGKESIGVLDAEGSLDYLRNTYPEVAENFAKHSGTEMGSIESHTKDVLKQWKTQLAPEELADISNRFGTDVNALLNVALPLHDIGKPGALAAGDKTMQHAHTIPIMQDVLAKEGFDEREIALATELFNHDMIGSLLQGSSKLTPQGVADQIAKKADKLSMNPSDFAKLQLAFFQADASSYPFVTQYMKQQPNGGWISGSPKVKPIEDLIAGPSAVKSAPATVETNYTLKVPEDEAIDMLGGTKNKAIYTKGGQDYLFKEANPPYFADQEVSANKISNLSGLHPIKIEKSTMGGKPGTMQAAVGNSFNWPTLKEVDPKTLTAEELRDIIRNHPVDWLTGNMDAHGGQFLKTPNGIVEVDRGRAFKSYQGNKQHEDFNPTGGFGYEDQLYNVIVKEYKKGNLPQLTEGDIKTALDQTIFKMEQNHGPIMQEIYRGLDRSNQTSLYTVANKRMLNLRTDMFKFWSKK